MYFGKNTLNAIENGKDRFKAASPFPYLIIDNFFDKKVAKQLSKDFMPENDPKWLHYENAIEKKQVFNQWHEFPALTYQTFCYLSSPDFVSFLSELLDVKLYPDPGLHGGGWHFHKSGGILNPHLDYSIHPKMRLQRRLNLIVYLQEGLYPWHGGHLGLWSEKDGQPDKLTREIYPRFNRAVLFDTTKGSWHGIARSFKPPKNKPRKSIALYYVQIPQPDADQRERALFAPTKRQKSDKTIGELIQKRSSSKTAESVHREK